MTDALFDVSSDLKQVGLRFGYGVAVAINVAMLIVVQSILDRGWLPFLTDEFATVVPWISLVLFATIVANLVYLFNDEPIVKSTGQILVNVISIYGTYQIFQVFPFDFSGYEFNWEIVARVVLILAMIGAGIGVLAETVNLSRVSLQEKGDDDVHRTRERR